ncbi:MAG: flavin reductase family protein [Fusobacteriaceae bacterium]|nr:flavin reductase family protein [Fusobacteriaceae bacterium]
MKKIQFDGGTMLSPVPAVLVTSKNKKGVSNVLTIAWIGIVCSTPPLLSISIRPERLSYEYISETGEFTVNMPGKDIVKALDYCGVKSGRTNDKIKECGFTMLKGKKVKSEVIKECPVNLECKVKDIIKTGGSHDIFLAEIVCVHVDADLIDKNKKIHVDEAELIAYAHGEYFPLNKKRIGSFGFSVSRKKRVSPQVQKKQQKEKPGASNKEAPEKS